MADATRSLHRYTQRWHTERYHALLAAGCRVERRQLPEASALGRSRAPLRLVAWRLHAPCTPLLSAAQWQALACSKHRRANRPSSLPDLHTAQHWRRRLGGSQRTGGAPPEVPPLWLCLRRLPDINETWRIMRRR